MAFIKIVNPKNQVLIGLFAICSVSVHAQSDRPIQRVVSLGGDITEIIYACNVQDRLVGVDTTSLYPPKAAELSQVGYLRRLNAEGILSLGPDLVIGSADAGPPEVVEQIEQTSVPFLKLEEHHTFSGLKEKIGIVTDALEIPDCKQRLADTIDQQVRALMHHLDQRGSSDKPSVMFVLNAGEGSPNVAGLNTGANAIIQMAGGVNAVTGYQGYKPMSAEAVITAAPDVILMFDQRLEQIGGLSGLAQMPGFGVTPAVRDARVYGMDGLLLLGFGPRLAEAALELSRLLYSENG